MAEIPEIRPSDEELLAHVPPEFWQRVKLGGTLWALSGNHKGMDDEARTNWTEALTKGIYEKPQAIMDALVDAGILMTGYVDWAGEWSDKPWDGGGFAAWRLSD